MSNKCVNKRPVPPFNYVGVVGPTGPTGPAGTSFSGTYGRKYNTSTDTINVVVGTASVIPLATVGPSNNVTTSAPNVLTIVEAGTYEISYSFRGSSSANGDVTVEVTQNTNPIGNTSIIRSVTANQENDFVGSSIVTLNAGDQIGLSIESSVAATVTPADGTNAYLNIVRLS